MMQETYLWKETEVVLTGRTAERQYEQRGRRGNIPRIEFRYEIKPASSEDGTWTAWVRKEELFNINDTKTMRH